MLKLILVSLIIIIFISTPGLTIAQEFSAMEVDYVFWSPPKYSVDGKNFEPVMGFLSTNFKTEFLYQFDDRQREYQLVNRARTKFNVGNWLMLVPAGLCFGIATGHESGRTPLIIAGSLLLIGDFVIGISGYQDLSKAADLRNRRLMPTVSIRF
jgi:hypothetical protein